MLPVLLLALAYAGGYVSQFLINYHAWASSGGTPGDGTSPAFPEGSPAACLKALTVFPYSLYGIALCAGVSGLLVFMVMRMGFGRRGTYDRERNLTYSDQGTYGTSGFMTVRRCARCWGWSPTSQEAGASSWGSWTGRRSACRRGRG